MTTANHDWTWLIRYGIVILIALILSSAFAGMDLFSQTWVVKGKLTAAKLVQFFGYTTALATFWIAGKQLSLALQGKSGRWSFLQYLLLPIVSLVVVSAAHSVSLLVLNPLLSGDLKTIYNWLFIIAILACAAWVVMAALGQSSALSAAFKSSEIGSKTCPHCGAQNPEQAKFCLQCAQPLN